MVQIPWKTAGSVHTLNLNTRKQLGSASHSPKKATLYTPNTAWAYCYSLAPTRPQDTDKFLALTYWKIAILAWVHWKHLDPR